MTREEIDELYKDLDFAQIGIVKDHINDNLTDEVIRFIANPEFGLNKMDFIFSCFKEKYSKKEIVQYVNKDFRLHFILQRYSVKKGAY